MGDRTSAFTLNEQTLREPLRAWLARRHVVRAAPAQGTASSVLIPLYERGGEARVWLVRRAQHLRTHGGQVALPGGKADASDATRIATALREAEEEIGLPPASVDVLGRLDDLVTGTGFTIAPFVGWVPASFAPTPNSAEVARVFDVPLREFLLPPEGTPPFHGPRSKANSSGEPRARSFATSSGAPCTGRYFLNSLAKIPPLSSFAFGGAAECALSPPRIV